MSTLWSLLKTCWRESNQPSSFDTYLLPSQLHHKCQRIPKIDSRHKMRNKGLPKDSASNNSHLLDRLIITNHLNCNCMSNRQIIIFKLEILQSMLCRSLECTRNKLTFLVTSKVYDSERCEVCWPVSRAPHKPPHE
jgi:hypothetical protein